MKASVIVRAFNSAQYIGEALNSILAQTRQDYDLIIVDDGSNDETADIVASYCDSRIRYVRLPVHCGPSVAMNIGIASSESDYIAILDSDDISLPDRLERQCYFLDQNPHIDIVGARITRFLETVENVIPTIDHPSSDAHIKAAMINCNGTAIVHPATMVRRSSIDKCRLRYPPYSISDDHAFWIQCIRCGFHFANLEDKLILKRKHRSAITDSNSQLREHEKYLNRLNLLPLFYPKIPPQELAAIAVIMRHTLPSSSLQIMAGILAVQKAHDEHRSYFGESREILKAILSQYEQRALRALESGNLYQ